MQRPSLHDFPPFEDSPTDSTMSTPLNNYRPRRYRGHNPFGYNVPFNPFYPNNPKSFGYQPASNYYPTSLGNHPMPSYGNQQYYYAPGSFAYQYSPFDPSMQFGHFQQPHRYWTPPPAATSQMSPVIAVTGEYADSQLAHIPPNPKNFVPQRKLGAGVFGEVIEVTEEINGLIRHFAVKRVKNWEGMPKKEVIDCKREIELLQSVDHENVIKCFSSYRDLRDLVIVLEYADGGDLKKKLEETSKKMLLLDEPTIWEYFRQIAIGLQALHAKNILHRDLKPENIFLTKHGLVKIGDLGLSKNLATTRRELTIKVGTPYYMAPEKMSSTHYDYKSDVWGIGCLLYEMAVQRSPFYGECSNSVALMLRISRADYAPIPTYIYSEQLCLVVYQCLRPSPKDRLSLNDLIKISEKMLCSFNAYEGECTTENEEDRLDNTSSR